jgi:hypothetical protein
MNDEGVVVGRSKVIGPDVPVAWVLAPAIMKWQISGTALNQYADPIYIVPGFEYVDPWGDLEKALVGEAPRIADDGTVSALSYYVEAGNLPVDIEWVASGAQVASHSKEMTMWANFDLDSNIQYRSGGLIGASGGLLVEHHPSVPKTVLHYRNGANLESLEGLLPSTVYGIDNTDIGRTPPTSESPGGRIWFSVNHDGGNVVFLEKRNGGSGISRWHNIPSMADGAVRINARGEAITRGSSYLTPSATPKIWRNGKYTELNEISSKPASVTITNAIDLASNGMILAQAVENGVAKTGLLLPVEVAVDADQNGEITFDGNDKTTAEKPFRFWINNDQDNVEIDEPIEVALPDWSGAYILTKRDLEDFCRLRIAVGIDNSQLRSGDLQIGVKFAGANSGVPYIRCWENQSLEGDSLYLTDIAAADRQKSLVSFPRNSQTGISMIPKEYWAKRTDSTADIIFEGVERGKGKLVVTIHDKNGLSLGEGGETWIQLLDVREMYQRARIVNEPEAIPHPWDNPNPPAQAWSWDPWDWPYSEDPDAKPITAVFVHGWRLRYMDFMNWSDTSYKRLWHQGFKGKFYSFRWASFSADNNGLPYGLDEELEDNSGGSSIIIPPGGLTYNASEYRAWLCGPALASFVNQLPNPGKRSLFAHSMGNVISGAALRSGMSVQRYAMCNSAVAAMAYDPTRIHPDYTGYKTPDTDHDPAIRNGYGLASKFSGLANMPQIFNFSLPADEALKGWLSNNKFFKADHNKYYWYQEYPEPMTTYRLFYNPFQNNFRNVTGLPEAMGYLTQSRSLPAGADLLTAGSVNNAAVDMTSWGFGKTHSAVWRWSNQKSHLFWENLVEKLDLKPQD